jgi:hypothetical protein
MGRKTSNQFVEGTIAAKKGTEHLVFDVKLPNSVKVTYKEKISAHLDGTPIFGEAEMYLPRPFSEKTKIRKELIKNGIKVVKITPQIVRLSDLCPNCHRRGKPRIEQKDTTDKRKRSWKNKDEKPITKRPNEQWLIYVHKTKPYKCRIQQAVNTPYTGFKKNLRKDIDMRKYYYPYVTEFLKNQFSKQ